MTFNKTTLAALLACASAGAYAQTSSVTLYGDIDMYLNYMRSSSGVSIKSLNDGSNLRSRFGLKGFEDLGSGMGAKFQLESGLSADTGAAADSARLFDRQAWVGLTTTMGEFRAGRQNTAIFYRGDYIDYSSRTLGSMVNNFGVPSRYDNDLSYQTPRMEGLMLEAHYALGERPASAGSQAVYQLAADYLIGPVRVGYAGIKGMPYSSSDTIPATVTSPVTRAIVYNNFYANYDYGQGKLYATFVRTNNSTSSTTTSNNGANILGGVGALVSGNTTATPNAVADSNRFYNIVQLSGDYRVTPSLRVGALIGRISDPNDSSRNATGGSIGAYYDLSKRTTLIALAETMKNSANAGFRPSGSAGLAQNFTGADANGQKISGMQLGVIHRF